MTSAYFSGLKLALGLIAAIGAQNAFVLRQGLRREHVLAVVLFCAVSDAALVTLGVSGFAVLAGAAPWAISAMLWGGIAFLVFYGFRAFHSAWTGGAGLRAAAGGGAPLWPVIATAAMLTWGNPHVYLDTVVLLGAISAQFPGREAMFGAGAVTGSLLFFFTLGYGARLLAPLFAKPVAWRVLDAVIGLTMWSIAASLALR